MPSTHIHSPASPTDARGRYPTCESQGNSDPLTLLAARQAAAWDAFLASPEFARQQAGQQALIAEWMQRADAVTQLFVTTDQALVQPRRQGDVDQRGSQQGATS
jgi:hypothetical protein